MSESIIPSKSFITTSDVLNKIAELNNSLTQTPVSLTLAREQSAEISQLGVKWIIQIFHGSLYDPSKREFNQDCDALLIVDPLVELLSLPSLTQQKDIQYSLAKACRLFTESLVFQVKCNQETHGVISHVEKEKYLTLFSNKRGLFPKDNVALHYELKCAHAAAHTLISDQCGTFKYLELIQPILIGAITQSWSEFVESGIQLFQEILKDLPQRWFNDVVALSWNSHFFLEKPDKTLPEALKILQAAEKYHDSKEIAFHTVETLADMIPYFAGKGDITCLLKGSESSPGLLTMIGVEKKGWQAPQRGMAILEKWMGKKKIDKTMYNFTRIKNITGKMDPFWKVRTRALERLKLIFDNCSEEDQKYIQGKIDERIGQEKVNFVVQSLEAFKRNNDPNWIQLMKQRLPQVNKHKNELQKEIKPQEDKAKGIIGTQKVYESQDAEETEPIPLTLEQQLVLLQLALQEEIIKTEEMKVNHFIPKK